MSDWFPGGAEWNELKGGRVKENEEPTLGEHLKRLIELLEEQEKENPSPIWLTAPRKNNDSEEEE